MRKLRGELSKYRASLARHPGWPIATSLVGLGFVAGIQRGGAVSSGLVGAAIMSVFFIPVLLTAWTLRNDQTENGQTNDGQTGKDAA